MNSNYFNYRLYNFYLRVKNKLKVVSVILILLIVAHFIFEPSPFSIITFITNSFKHQLLIQGLAKEFQGSYPENAKVPTNTVEVDLVAKTSEIELVPGVKTQTWSYNGQIPGPEIKIRLGEKVKINFTNQLPQETTIHFHGVRLPNKMDGVPGITQDPIPVNGKFVYEFTPKDAGTFWFHPHVRSAEQVEKGLYGILIVEDPDDPKFSQDKTIVLDDWRLLDSGQIDPRFVTPGDLSHDGRWGNVISVNGKLNEAINVKLGERIRLRFINSSNGRVYQLNFGDLATKAIAVDGLKVNKTFSPQNYKLAPGNRLDVEFIVDSNNQSVIQDVFTRSTYNLITFNVSSERVVSDLTETPLQKHFPDWANASSLEPDQVYRLNARKGGEHGIEWTINDKAHPDTETITLAAGKFSKIRFINESARLHPMHLHGQFFRVLSRNGQKVDEQFWRDTVLIHSKETIDIGIVPLDKGTWMSHCHVLEHAEAGMMTLIKVK